MQRFLKLLERSGYFNPWVDLTDQQRYDLLGAKFWREVSAMGFDVVTLKRQCWKMAGRPEADFTAELS